MFLSCIIITKDDRLRYADKIPECKNAKLKKPILVDIYILKDLECCIYHTSRSFLCAAAHSLSHHSSVKIISFLTYSMHRTKDNTSLIIFKNCIILFWG